MKLVIKLFISSGFLFASQFASARLVENGESFIGFYTVETQLRVCGYDPNLKNSILGQVFVSANVYKLMIESVVEHYSQDGGLVTYYSFTIGSQPPRHEVAYTSSTSLSAYEVLGYSDDPVKKEVYTDLNLDSLGNLTLAEHSSFRPSVVCHYTRIN